MTKASELFARGREAALAGDFDCARDFFRQAIAVLRPETGEAPTDPELLAYSFQLYESALRYEALAGPAEEAGTSDGQMATELNEIAEPATAEGMVHAKEAVDSDTVDLSYDIPIIINEPVLRILAAFQNDERIHGVISRGLARSGRYMPMIHRIFGEEGIPRDLAQLALIESSFLPHARSPMSAHGIWQFMPRTGRQFGLTANAIVDERSDPEKATRAAARYLSYLHELFDDWYLAMAAYNAGEGKILRAMQRTGARDFWELAASGAIRPQTQNYVPAVIAATLIARNPVHYGFEVEYEAPMEYETVTLDRPVHLKHLAGEDVQLEELRHLNPELKSSITPRQPEGYELKVPLGTREDIRLAFAGAPTAVFPIARRHVVRRGETLARIARRYGVSVASLASVNGLSRRGRIAKGRVLVVPGRHRVEARYASARKSRTAKAQKTLVASRSKTRPPGRRAQPKHYQVRSGDTLYRIALKHGTTVARILAVNSIPSWAKIRPGDRIRIPAAR
ncbi:MAG TPA: LysM peptidoglycan-binding domain-containing protein [Thermoanaerobaculia bacterium]|nr:LysM peptidoglycan-binding domain-containing protein [Thermoanaerobaculia bacterium]